MRFLLIMTASALALSGCVVQNPAGVPAPAPTVAPPVVVPDAARSNARVVVNREMARRLPGANVAPYTDCVMQNATSAELATIADSASSASSTVAGIVSRPTTTQCIAGAAAAAKGAA
ncbi:hypothetical protein [Paracoccus broussonetiae]|uniref:Succinate dehydrogenase n=1 Tax=Paracoccus broussonetiae subsp. drimophilus TaxID=3373869 RepID=A0ABW7LMY3_9RHOB